MNLTDNRHLVVVADDCAMSIGVTRGIAKACQNGIVRATSVMANSPYLEESLSLLRKLPNIDLGIHLNLTWGRPILSPNLVPSLVNQEGGFYRLGAFTKKTLLGRIKVKEVYQELETQIKKLLLLGIAITHADSHQHTHIFPIVRQVVGELALKYHIPFVRGLTNKRFTLLEGPWHRRFFMGSFLGAQASFWKKQGLKTLDSFYGYFTQGSEGLLERWVYFLKTLPPGTTEVMVHPGYIDDLKGDHYREGRQQEIEVLCSLALKEAVKMHPIHLVRFSEL